MTKCCKQQLADSQRLQLASSIISIRLLARVSMSLIGLHFTLQLNVIFKRMSSHPHSVIIPGIEFITNFKNKIGANLRRRRVWTTCLKDEALTSANTGEHPSVGLSVPFCKKPQEWRIRERSVWNIARIETGHLFLNNRPLSDAVGKYKIIEIISNYEKTEVVAVHVVKS